MKNILTTLAFFVLSFGIMAQQNTLEDRDIEQPFQDQLDQQQLIQIQTEVERAAAREAQRIEAERKQKEVEEAANAAKKQPANTTPIGTPKKSRATSQKSNVQSR